jgi:hypothetical protein
MKKLSLLLVAFALYTSTYAAVNQNQTTTATQRARQAGEQAYDTAQQAGAEAYESAKQTAKTVQQKTESAWEEFKKQASAWWQKLTGDTTGAYGAACPGDYGTYDTATTAAADTGYAAATTDAVGTTADANDATAGNNTTQTI